MEIKNINQSWEYPQGLQCTNKVQFCFWIRNPKWRGCFKFLSCLHVTVPRKREKGPSQGVHKGLCTKVILSLLFIILFQKHVETKLFWSFKNELAIKLTMVMNTLPWRPWQNLLTRLSALRKMTKWFTSSSALKGSVNLVEWIPYHCYQRRLLLKVW